MIMKRQADGEWVRLRCSVCHRSNFNNIQGFLNHCRIAHHQDYKSHEAAAIACGEIVQVDEATMTASDPAPTIREPQQRVNSIPLPLPTPLPRVDSMLVTTPIEQPHVNPLIIQTSAHKPLERVVDLSSTGSPKPSVARSSMKNGFKGSLTPHLTALMQRRGLSTAELPSFIADAKKKVDLSVYDVSDSEHDHDSKIKKHKQKKPKSTQRSQSTPTTTLARPPSAKGAGRQAPTFAIVPPPATGVGFHPSVFQHVVPETPSDGDVEMDLSPGTAPGLVSDHDDDFDDDEAKSANGSHHDVSLEDVEIRDASDVEREERKRISTRVLDGEEGERVCRHAPGGAGMC
jgi:ADA HAT complex component 1